MTVYKEHTNEQICVDIVKYITRQSYNANGLVEYIGVAIPGTASDAAGWQIRKCAYSSNRITSILFASSNNNFDKVWDDKGDYTYG